MIKFTAAYVDVSHGPETQMWLFSTLETETEEQDESVDEVLYRSQLDLVVSSVSHLAESYGGRLAHRDAVLLGTLHSRVRRLLGETVTPRKTGLYDKWIFKAEGLSEASGDLEEGMSWDVARERDLEIAISRTHIPRTV